MSTEHAEEDKKDINLEAQKKKVRGIPVCIIIPPSPFLADERVFPFLGPLMVAAELLKNGNPVSVLDLSGYDLGSCLRIVEKYMHENPTSTYGLTATTPQLSTATAIAIRIKELSPGHRVILGGPHVTLTHSAYLQDKTRGLVGRGSIAFEQFREHFDCLVVGDGEKAVFYAIDHDHSQIVDAGNLKSPLYLQRGTLDEYSHPARELIDLNSYHYFINGHRAFSVISQLGCPFKCGFCGGRDSHVFRVARSRSVNSIIQEIREVMLWSFQDNNKPLTGVMFYDDELNVRPGGLEILCKGLIQLQSELAQEIPPTEMARLGLQTTVIDGETRIKMGLRGFVKAELFTPDQAGLMAKAGFKQILVGIESSSDQILRAMQKGTSSAINSRCVEIAHDAGLTVKALMSIGHPGESEETIAKPIDWALTNLTKGDEIDWTIITQYPGSPYYDRSIYVPEMDLWLYQYTDPVTRKIMRL